jgi:glycosyltransferase involved in cell wall biosynthesis
LVSVVIPVRNERAFIACCLDSVLANDYPAGRLEILAVDGMSDDGTRDILADYASRHPALRLLDNPARITPAALNRGIREARGELVVRLDAHARLAPDYISQCVAWAESSGADNVGGRMRTLPRGSGLVAEAIALALGHPFGVGNSAFRTNAAPRTNAAEPRTNAAAPRTNAAAPRTNAAAPRTNAAAPRTNAAAPRWVDTVFGGCYRRGILERVGEFNERLPRGQDLEFNLRLKRAGGRTLLVPSIRCDYFARCDPRSFLRHNWTNGVWAIRPFAASEIVPVRPRHLVPLGLVLALSGALAIWLAPVDVLTLGPLFKAVSFGPVSFGPATFGPVSFGPVSFGALLPALEGFRSWPVLLLVSCYLAAALVAATQLAWRARNSRLWIVLPAVFVSLHLAYGLGSLWGVFEAAAAIARCAIGVGGPAKQR